MKIAIAIYKFAVERRVVRPVGRAIGNLPALQRCAERMAMRRPSQPLEHPRLRHRRSGSQVYQYPRLGA